MYQKTCIPNNADGSAAAPVHITLGNGGQWLSTQYNPYQPEWLQVRQPCASATLAWWPQHRHGGCCAWAQPSAAVPLQTAGTGCASFVLPCLQVHQQLTLLVDMQALAIEHGYMQVRAPPDCIAGCCDPDDAKSAHDCSHTAIMCIVADELLI